MTVALSPRRAVTPPPLHIAFPGKLAEEVRDLAERRGDHAPAMVAELMRRLIDKELVDKLMSEKPPEAEPVGQGRRRFEDVSGELTMLQCGVIYVLGFHCDDDGVFRLPTAKISLILGRSSQSYLAAILPVLKDRCLVECVPGRAGARHWRLTHKGRLVFSELAGDKE